MAICPTLITVFLINICFFYDFEKLISSPSLMPIKILDIVWYKFLPARFGGQKGIEGFLTALTDSCEVVVLCSKNNTPTGAEPYKVLPLLPTSKLQFINAVNWRLIRKICVEEKITHIFVEHPYYHWGVRYANRMLQLPVIIHSHNIEAERFKSLGKWWWKRLWKYEGIAYRQADFNLFKTALDMAYAVDQYHVPPEKCMVLPYSLSANHKVHDKRISADTIRKQYHIPATHKILLFSGTLDYKPNATAVEKIYSHIAPLMLNAFPHPFTILICGRNELPAFSYVKDLQHPNIQQIGFVENIDELTAAANVFINPVTEGGGVQTKTLDALGQHTTVVSFASGAAGIDIKITGQKLQVCSDGDYVGMVELLNHSMKQDLLTSPVFFENYSWAFYIKRLMTTIFSLSEKAVS